MYLSVSLMISFYKLSVLLKIIVFQNVTEVIE